MRRSGDSLRLVRNSRRDASGLAQLLHVLRRRFLRSVHADRLELLAPGVGERGFTRIGQHDRRAIGGMQRK
jgi:hypothetical protein